MNIGSDCWELINDYKYQLEHTNRFKLVLDDINNLKSYCRKNSNTIYSILRTPLWFHTSVLISRTKVLFNCDYKDNNIHNIYQQSEDYYIKGSCYYKY